MRGVARFVLGSALVVQVLAFGFHSPLSGAPGSTEATALALPLGGPPYVMCTKRARGLQPYGSTQAIRESDGNGIGTNSENSLTVGFWLYNSVTPGMPGLPDPIVSTAADVTLTFIFHDHLGPQNNATDSVTPVNPTLATEDFRIWDFHTNGYLVPTQVSTAWQYTKVIPMGASLGDLSTKIRFEAIQEAPQASDGGTGFEQARIRILSATTTLSPPDDIYGVGWHTQRFILEDSP